MGHEALGDAAGGEESEGDLMAGTKEAHDLMALFRSRGIDVQILDFNLGSVQALGHSHIGWADDVWGEYVRLIDVVALLEAMKAKG